MNAQSTILQSRLRECIDPKLQPLAHNLGSIVSRFGGVLLEGYITCELIEISEARGKLVLKLNILIYEMAGVGPCSYSKVGENIMQKLLETNEKVQAVQVTKRNSLLGIKMPPTLFLLLCRSFLHIEKFLDLPQSLH